MRHLSGKGAISAVVAAGVVLSLGVFAFAQNQTTSTSQSQSGNGQSSASASASSRAQSGGSVTAGQMGGASVAGAPVKGNMFVIYWTPNLQTRAGADMMRAHQQYLLDHGKTYGVLLEGMIGGDEPGRMAVVQTNAGRVQEFAMNSPLVVGRFATYKIAPYSVEYSRVGVVADKGDLPTGSTKSDGESNSSNQTSKTSNSSGSTQSSGSGG